MKDAAEGATWAFRLVPFDIAQPGASSSASEETITCTVDILSEPTQAQVSASKPKKPPSGVAGDLLKVVRRAVDEMGEIGAAGSAAPRSVRAVSRDNLKNYCRTMDWQQNGKPNAFRSMLSQSLSKLRAADLIDFNKDWLWLT